MRTKLLPHGLAFIAMCMMAIVPMKAEETKSALVVWNGETELYSFFISDRPVLKVYNGNAIIQSDGVWEESVNLQTITYKCYYSIPMSESSDYRITLEQRDYIGIFGREDETGLQEINSTTLKPSFSFHDGTLQVAGLKAGTTVTTVTTDGKINGQTSADQSGRASVSLRGQSGTIIVKAGEVSFKVLVR